MERAPFGKAAEKGLRRRRAGPGKMREFALRFLRSLTSNSHESYQDAAWISPDRTCEDRGYARGVCRGTTSSVKTAGTPKCRNRIRDRSSRPRPIRSILRLVTGGVL